MRPSRHELVTCPDEHDKVVTLIPCTSCCVLCFFVLASRRGAVRVDFVSSGCCTINGGFEMNEFNKSKFLAMLFLVISLLEFLVAFDTMRTIWFVTAFATLILATVFVTGMFYEGTKLQIARLNNKLTMLYFRDGPKKYETTKRARKKRGRHVRRRSDV